ncbi:hypothetical protein [Clostridium sp. B9]|uniref:hypothetical protein n=1 Tax=Clostridium sp. B9 TaxID=3423224 RepID=UPI003D2EEE76
MFFTINAYKTFLVTNNSYRLKKNGEWAFKDNFKNVDLEEDMIFKTHEEAERWLKEHRRVIINSEKVRIKSGSLSMLGNFDFSFKILVHREEKPHYFKKEELKSLLCNNEDDENALIINFDGKLELISKDSNRLREYEDFAVKNEEYKTYINSKAISNLEALEEIYLNMLEGWMFHLESGVSIKVDFYRTLDEEYIITELNRLYKELS